MTDISLITGEQQAVNIEELYPQNVQERSPDIDKNEAIMAAVVEAGGTYDPSIMEQFLPYGPAISDVSGQNSQKRRNQEFADELRGKINNSELNDVTDIINFLQQDPSTLEEDFLGTFNLDKEVMKQELASMQARKTMAEVVPSGLLDWAVSIGKVLVPITGTDLNLSLMDLTDEGPVESVSRTKELITSLRNASPEQKAAVFPAIKREVLKATGGDKLQTLRLLELLIDPEGENKLNTDVAIDDAFLALDTSLVLGTLSKVATVGTAISKARKLKASLAADIQLNEARAGSLEAASEIGLVDQGILQTHDPRLPFHVNKNIAKDQSVIDSNLNLDDLLIINDSVKPAERAAINDTLLKGSLDKPELLLAEVKEDLVDGTLMSYKLGTKSGGYFKTMGNAFKSGKRFEKEYGITGWEVKKNRGGWYVEYQDIYSFTKKDIGEFKGHESKNVVTWLASPTTKLSPIDPSLVKDATRALFNEATLKTRFNKTFKDLVKNTVGKSSKKKKAVDEVLLEGDRKNVTFTESQLRDHGLDDSQIRLYYGVRRIFDNVDLIENDMMRRQLQFNNMMWFRDKSTNTSGQAVRPYEQANEALQVLPKGNHVYDITENRGRALSRIDLGNLYDDGRVIVKFEEAAKFGDDSYHFAVVDRSSIEELPFRVKARKEGYVSKINKEGNFFVKQWKKGRVDGEPGNVFVKTLRGATSATEANKIMHQELAIRSHLRSILDPIDEVTESRARVALEDMGFNPDDLLDAVKNKQLDLSDDIRIKSDRELTPSERYLEDMGSGGGLFKSSRASELKFGLDSTEPERFSAFESLQRNLDYVAAFYPRNEWRLGVETRFMNTWRRYLKNPRDSFSNATIAENAPEPVKAGFKKAREYIRKQMRIRTGEEKVFQRLTQDLAHWAEGVKRIEKKDKTVHYIKVADNFRTELTKRFSSPLIELSHSDPTSYLRAIAFHTLLGIYNPAQLVVQGAGASVALSLHPIHGTKALKTYLGLRLIQADGVSAVATRKVAKAINMPIEELEDLRTMWIRGGLRDSVRTNADMEAAAKGYGIARNALANSLEHGLLFYREGDLFSKGVALDIARRKFMKGKRAGYRLTNQDMKDIIDDGVRLTLNMTQANAARWQQGILGVPTQFLQVHAKLAEALFGGEGFKGQRTRLALGQLAMFGAAGAPFARSAAEGLLDKMGVNEGDLPREAQVAITDGLTGMLIRELLNSDVSVVGRASIPSGIEDLIRGVMLEGSPGIKWAFGAFGGAADRFIQSAIIPAYRLAVKAYTLEEMDSLSKLDYVMYLDSLKNMAPVISNPLKALLIHNSGIVSSRQSGKVLFSDRDPGIILNFPTEVGIALGFQHSAKEDISQLMLTEGAEANTRKTGLEDMADAVGQVILQYYEMQSLGQEVSDEELNKMGNLINFMLSGLSPDDEQVVRNRIMRVYDTENSVLKNLVKKQAEKIGSELVNNPVLVPFYAGEE